MLGSQLEINKKLLGGYNILLKFVFTDNPHANFCFLFLCLFVCFFKSVDIFDIGHKTYSIIVV